MSTQTQDELPGTPIDVETAEVSELRFVVERMIVNLRGPDGRAPSRESALAVTKLQEAAFWLGEHIYKA